MDPLVLMMEMQRKWREFKKLVKMILYTYV